ncbi:BRCA1-associated RING domain protein 1 [Chanos chanos]|uniref:BRCA1-associated RING domain protein 1 n=1 Tax=Chanos chanos TaxID=29144 RepID=A0A6J2WJG9_CHACN|nr:BRCA1-associated RING domain protein 1 [Chanos chanos]
MAQHDPIERPESGVWKKTREAVAHFRTLLLCSKCSNFMSDPVCLGACDHLLCRSCASPQAGAGCSVCHSPAWVKDIQINRQLSNITELFRNLEALLNPSTKIPGTPTDSSAQLDKTAILKHKKNFKIWFSPKSRKVRCQLEKPVDVASSSKEPATDSDKDVLSSSNDLSVFNFSSSSQESVTSHSPSKGKQDSGQTKRKAKKNGGRVCARANGERKPSTRSQTKQQHKKKRLDDINQQWGFGREGVAEEKDEADENQSGSGENEGRSSKRVSFQCPKSQREETRVTVTQDQTQVHSPTRGILKRGVAKEGDPGSSARSANSACPAQRTDPVSERSASAEGTPTKPPPQGSRTPKRVRRQEGSLSPDSTPKRPRSSTSHGRRPVTERTTELPSPPATPDSSSFTPTRRTTAGQKESPGRSPVAGRNRSPVTPVLRKTSPGELRGSGGRPSQSSPAFLKRNRKGETPLHLAAIKGDVESVKGLLELGADPNLKDNAGWTPLHEACNLGHLGVVEVLLQQGALLNIPGYQNETPLHDAVRNGHTAVAKRLAECGASQNVLNMHGLRPADYAGTQEMKEVLRVSAVEAQPPISPLSSPSSLSKSPGCVRKEDPIAVLGSKLDRTQQNQLTKAAQLFGWNRVESFDSTVTHVIVPDSPMPLTLTALQAVLHGCWILRFSWVTGCLQAGGWTAESEHEAGEAAQRGRENRHSLLPPLFDGCFFYLLGSFRKPPRDELLQLIREGGGRLLNRQPKPDSDVTQTLSAAAYHARPGSDQALCTQYIIYDPQGSYEPQWTRLGKVWSAPSSWLLNCISAFQLLPVPELQSPSKLSSE